MESANLMRFGKSTAKIPLTDRASESGVYLQILYCSNRVNMVRKGGLMMNRLMRINRLSLFGIALCLMLSASGVGVRIRRERS